MALFGGKKTTMVNTSQTDVFNTNQSATSNAAPVNQGDGSQTVITHLSDFGAIQEASKATQAALIANTGVARDAIDFAADSTSIAAKLSLSVIEAYTAASRDSFDASLKLAQDTSKEYAGFAASVVKSESQAISEKLIQYVGLGMFVLAGIMLWKGMR